MPFITRIGKKLEPLMLFMGLVSPFATLPQMYKLFYSHSQHAEGLSMTTWVLYSFIALLWTVYGFYHKNPTIWLGNFLSFFMDLSMVFGIYLITGWTF